MTAPAATAADHSIALALVRDAAELLDTVDPGTATLGNHHYGRDITIRARRVYTDRQDALTLIAYRAGAIGATVIVHRSGGDKITARIHQMNVGGLLFTRRDTWNFTAQTRRGRAHFTLTGSRAHGWRLAATGAEPTIWADLATAADHIAQTYGPDA